MFKRTLLPAALFLVIVLFALLFFCGVDFLKEMPGSSEAVLLTGKIHKMEKKKGSCYLFLSFAAADTDEGRRSLGKVILVIPESSEVPKIGNKIEATCIHTGFRTARNFGNFDELAYYQSLGIAGKFELQTGDGLMITDASYDPIRQWLYETREKITNTFQNLLITEPEKAGVFSAIVTGDRSDVDGEVKTLYQKNGIAHILAVSGLHISLIGMGIFRILRKFFLFRTSGICASVVMLLFCIMSGGSASAVRATILFLVRMLAAILGKTFDMLSGISFSAICLLVTNPNYLHNTAFLLSFGAVLGIAVCANRATEYLDVESGIGKCFLASLSVFLATAPILMAAYYELNLYSILLNLAVIPLMSLILGSGIMGGLTGLMSLALAKIAIGSGVYLLSAVQILCTICNALPFCILVTGAPSPVRCVLFYLMLLAGCLSLRLGKQRKKKENRRMLSFGLWVLVLLLLLFVRIPSHTLQISVLDVDQGDGILLQMPEGSICLIDGGSSTYGTVGKNRMESAIKYLGIGTIDYAFISHPDTDHISGVIEFLSDESAGHIKIRNLVLPRQPENKNQVQLLAAAERADVPVTFVSAGMMFSFGEVTISCLHPSADFRSDSENGYSAVLSLTYRSFSALFTGDLEEEEEKLLLTKVSPGYDLLKVAHHGSRSSSSSDFLARIFDLQEEPLALISAGVKNTYGHPHKEVVDRLLSYGAEVICTKDCGEICVEVNRNGVMQVKTKL